jgi:hypothetical protein
MKKITLGLMLIVSFAITGIAQELEPNALVIKDKFNYGYENTIKKYALIKWKEDFSMVVYEINKQSDALTNIVEKFKSKNTTILYNAIIKWSQPNKAEANHKIWKELTSIDLATMLKFNVDWSMVEYEYEKQDKAANSF